MSCTFNTFQFTYLRHLHFLKTLHQVTQRCQSLSTHRIPPKHLLCYSNGSSYQRRTNISLDHCMRGECNKTWCLGKQLSKCTGVQLPSRSMSTGNTVFQNSKKGVDYNDVKRNILLLPVQIRQINAQRKTALWTSSQIHCKKIYNKHSDRWLFSYSYRRNYSTASGQLSVQLNPLYREYLVSLQAEYDKLMVAMTSGDQSASNKNMNVRIQELSTVVSQFKHIEEKLSEIKDLDGLIAVSRDNEMIVMATNERIQLLEQIEEDEQQLVLLLAGESRIDHNDIILELTAGIGGQEAMLFTSEMFDMYEGYAAYKGWNFNTLSYELSEAGGLRRASVSVTGTDVFKHLKFEGGVHRVQRIPKTEKSGRLHTSTMTVAILPQPHDIDITINPKDLLIETFRASGKGGQHVNTTDSAVRITYVPTKTVAECQVERSQLRNKELALQILRSRLYEIELNSQTAQVQMARKLQTGSGGRSEKIRTYNFPQDRITDHRLAENFHNMDVFMKGRLELDDLILGMMWKVKCDIVEDALEEFAKIRKTGKS